jgi:carbamoyl-phosphate synthase large subunit
MNILILSAGGPAGYGTIKSLKGMNFDGKIVSIDNDELAVGFHMSDKYYVVPRVTDDNYISKLCDIVDKENINLILPTGPDVEPISKNSHLFEGKLFMSDYNSIKLCNDKLEFYKKCKDKFLFPKTTDNRCDAFFNRKLDSKNVFAKPRIELGGSRGATDCQSYEHGGILENKYGDIIYQERLPGQEYTIDVLCDMESNPLVVIPRKRLQTKAGISSKGEIIKDKFIEKACFDMCKFLKLKGPICLQMKEDIDGNPNFIEVNPRFGGGTYFTTLAGVNFVKIIIDVLNGKDIFINEPKLIKVLRYFEEVIV